MVIGLEYNSVSNWAGDFKSAECVVKINVKKINLKIIEIILLLLIQ